MDNDKMNFETSISRRAELAQSEDEDRTSRGRWIIIAALIALLVVGLLAWKMTQANKLAVPKKEDSQQQQAPSVTVTVPGHKVVEGLVTANGTLAARYEMPVGATGEGGIVSRVWVDQGSWVQAGQVLVSIERSVQTQQSNQLVAQIAANQADAHLAQNELDRARALAGRGFVSKADVDRKTAQRDAAAARVRVAQAQLAENRARMGKLDVRAPASGLVLTRAVEPGQVVGPGSGVLFRIARGGEMELKAAMTEADLARMSVGLSAQVTPVGANTAFSGVVWQLPAIIDPQTRQGLVRIALAYDRALRPGGFASVRITSGTADVPLLPESAVLSDPKGNFVYVVNAQNKIERRDVTVGSINEQGVTVMAGLSGEEKVVLSAGGFLNPGESVNPKRAPVAAN